MTFSDSEKGPRCAACNQLLYDKFHTGVFFHAAHCGAVSDEPTGGYCVSGGLHDERTVADRIYQC